MKIGTLFQEVEEGKHEEEISTKETTCVDEVEKVGAAGRENEFRAELGPSKKTKLQAQKLQIFELLFKTKKSDVQFTTHSKHSP